MDFMPHVIFYKLKAINMIWSIYNLIF